MADVVAGVGVSHIPALGVAMTATGNPATAEVFERFAPVRSWIEELDLDTVVLVYNDHASAFSLELLPTFAIGAAAFYEPADEGYGSRDVPTAEGDSDLAWHIINTVIPAGFDLTVCQKLDVDHGFTVPLSVIFGSPEKWPVRVVPIAVNVIQQPTPSARRCYELGQAIGSAIASFTQERRVGVIGTGGMSHQLQGRRAGHINTVFDQQFLADIVDKPSRLADMTNIELLREAGSEGAELIMWLVMRGALGPEVNVGYSAYHVPVSNTAAGIIALLNEPEPEEDSSII